jgi:hypothetical protein
MNWRWSATAAARIASNGLASAASSRCRANLAYSGFCQSVPADTISVTSSAPTTTKPSSVAETVPPWTLAPSKAVNRMPSPPPPGLLNGS